MPVILATQETEIRRIVVQSQTLSWKNPSQKRTGGVVQEVQHMPSNLRPCVSTTEPLKENI
jgi:hypothetical protein